MTRRQEYGDLNRIWTAKQGSMIKMYYWSEKTDGYCAVWKKLANYTIITVNHSRLKGGGGGGGGGLAKASLWGMLLNPHT